MVLLKRYKLNEDFSIYCGNDSRGMFVRVVLESVRFEPVIEELKSIKDKDSANSLFKQMVNKYREPLSFC